jgi:predicted site-specific integrase-resolvase
MKTLFTRKETAELLGMSVRTVDKLTARGELERVVLTHKAIRITGRSIKKLVGIPLETAA